MQELDDSSLLREYVERASGEAFAALVARHVNKVYSVALRHTKNPHEAEEITQAVFVILAKKSCHLSQRVVLSGWLYQTARLTAVTFIRSEIRRTRREQEAHMQSMLNENDSNAWTQIAPMLDAAMAGLNETDRHAVVLRFFDGKSLREVGVALSANEDTARKRINRAVEKLRSFFTKRSIVLSAAVLTTAISANSVQAAPATLAKTATALALGNGVVAGSSTLTLIKGALKLMAWTKAKIAVAVGIGILLAVGTTTVAVKEIEQHRTYPWQVPDADFAVFYKMPADVIIVPTKFTMPGGLCWDGNRGGLGINQPLDRIIQVAYLQDKLRTIIATDLPTNKYDFIAKLVGPREAHKNIPVNTNWYGELQKVITKQFGITGKVEMREADVLILKSIGAEVRNFTPDDKMPKGRALEENGAGQYVFHAQPITILKGILERNFQIPLVDKTGLDKLYDFALSWEDPDPQHPNLEGLKQALREQLGLELVPNREPIQMLVVKNAKD